MCKYLGILMRNIHQCVKSPFPKDGIMGGFCFPNYHFNIFQILHDNKKNNSLWIILQSLVLKFSVEEYLFSSELILNDSWYF